LYEHNPDLRAIIMAQPPNAMAYAVTACQFDSRTIPESYVMLRDVPLISYEAFYESYAAITRAVSARTPVALVQNECVIAVGASVLQAFDRLEVLEFSARSLIDTPALGALVPMNDEALEALRKAFSLE
jgi:L-fuculose-phosphate aldolase